MEWRCLRDSISTGKSNNQARTNASRRKAVVVVGGTTIIKRTIRFANEAIASKLVDDARSYEIGSFDAGK